MTEAFERAWALLKMPVYDTDAGVQFVTQGQGENWANDPNVYGDVRPEGPVEMMTPNEFLQWWGSGGGRIYGRPEDRDVQPYPYTLTPRQAGFAQRSVGYQTRFDEAESNPDIKFGMPWLRFVGDNPKPEKHDGRHRMAELIERGHGDTPLPVRVDRE